MLLKLKRPQWAIVFACASMFVLGMADNIRGPLFAELMSFFKLSNSEGSMTFAASSTAALVGSLSSVLFLKRLNLSQTLVASVVMMGVGVYLMGAAPTFTSYMLYAVIFGFSLGLMGVVQNVIVAETVSKERQSKVLSGLHGVYGLSSLLAPLIASRAPEIFGPWRSAFFITSAIAAVVFVAALLVKPNPSFEVHAVQTTDQDKASWWALLTLGGVFAFYVVAEILVSTRLALYMRTYFQMDLEQSSNYVTYFFIFLLLGRVAFAIKAFGHSLKMQLNISLTLSLIMLCLGLWVHPFFLALVGLAMAPFYPLSVAFISEETGVHKRKFITFAMGFQSFCVIAMHLGVGYLTDRFGLFYAFGVGLAALSLSLFCVNFHPKVNPT